MLFRSNGGGGARPDRDGVSCQDELVVNVMNSPVEAIETEFPVRVERYELRPDSAGAGKFRGGLGARRVWLGLTEESIINFRTDRFKHSSPGIYGARPAMPSRARLDPDTPDEKALTSKVAGVRLKKGMRVAFELGGGGGYGNPLERDPERVRTDVLRGYVTREGARKSYGVALRDDLSIDAAATQALRSGAAP